MSNCSQNCWINWNSAVLCFKEVFHIQYTRRGMNVCLICEACLTLSHHTCTLYIWESWSPCITYFPVGNLFFDRGSADVLTRIPFFASLCGSRVNMPHVAVTLCRMTCIHANVSRSPRGHGSVAQDKRHCRQWMSSLFPLFSGFLPNPFIHDLFLWRTSQEFIKTDLYPLSFMSLRYAVCSTGRWLIIGHWFGACQRSSCVEERRPQ